MWQGVGKDVTSTWYNQARKGCPVPIHRGVERATGLERPGFTVTFASVNAKPVTSTPVQSFVQ